MHCDWYAATIPDDVRILNRGLIEGMGGEFKNAKTGLNGYSFRQFLIRDEATISTVLHGGNNGANPHVFSSGANGQNLMRVVRDKWPVHTVSRVDVAEDMEGVGLFDGIADILVPIARDRKVSICTVGDWLKADSPAGKTLYLGSKSSAVRVRLYEKGKQVLAEQYESRGVAPPENFPINWVRLEIQCRPAGTQKMQASCSELLEIWGYSAWTRKIAEDVFSLSVPRVKADLWKKADDEQVLRWMVKQYANVMDKKAKTLGSWSLFGEFLGKYVADLKKYK